MMFTTYILGDEDEDVRCEAHVLPRPANVVGVEVVEGTLYDLPGDCCRVCHAALVSRIEADRARSPFRRV